ncbi:putative transposase [Streptomyces lincolnensis]|uniref:Putative transposase n=1 Tax=Streptomyces lincolnensis TaxID=1915 RepID=A0A1B1MBK4_STRLN|nr:putative transposase [Streptomyces lincolnensis]AXG54370.1 putative transposase [Streptomyces lincolnensis]
MRIGIVAVVLEDQAEARREPAELTGRSTGAVTITEFSSGNCSSRPSPPSPAYAGKLVDWAKQHLNLTVKPVSRPKDACGSSCCPY